MFFNNRFCCNGQNMQGMNNGCGCDNNRQFDCPCDPVVEPVIEKCVTRDICHTVEHVCPIHTRVINNHIVQHNYRPEYTCSEENVVTNVDPGCCNKF